MRTDAGGLTGSGGERVLQASRNSPGASVTPAASSARPSSKSAHVRASGNCKNIISSGGQHWTYGIDLLYLSRKDRAIPQRVDVGRVEAVCFAITIGDLLAETYVPNPTCEGNSSRFIGGDEAKWILPRLLSKFISPFWIVFQVGRGCP